MKESMIAAMRSHAQGHISKHLMNVGVFLNNPVGVGEHPDVFESIEAELLEVAKYDDILEMLEKYVV